MNLRKSIIGVFAAIGIAVGLSAYYPGDDGFDMPSYGNGTFVNSVTVGGGTSLTSTHASTDYVNINTDSLCTTGRINIDGCLTNSVNPIINVGGDYNCPSGQNCHVYSSSRKITITSGMAANDYDSRGEVYTAASSIDHFASYQAAITYSGIGTMQDYFGVFVAAPVISSAGKITNVYGGWFTPGSPGLGQLDNSYGVYIAPGGTAAVKSYGLYVDSGSGISDPYVSRFQTRVGIFGDPVANRPLDVYGTASVGSWRSNIWATSTDYPTFRAMSTSAGKWSGFGNGSDGSFQILVDGSATGAPTLAGYVAADGGLVLGSATGGTKGLGTINVATNIYKNNTAYTNPDYIFEHYFTNKIVKFAKNEGAKAYKGLKPLSEVRNFVEKNHVLPRVADARNASKDGKVGLFDGGDALLASIEEAYLYLFKHETRIKQLEQENLYLRRDLEALKKVVYKK